MSEAKSDYKHPRYSWVRDDIECRIGLRGGRYTKVHSALWLLMAIVITAAFYGCLALVPQVHPKMKEAPSASTAPSSQPAHLGPGQTNPIVAMFTERGAVAYIEVFFFCWVQLILTAKLFKAKHQATALRFTDLVPQSGDFVLSPATSVPILRKLREECDDPMHFILFNRIDTALSNLKNMGQITEVDSVLQSQAGNDDDIMESSYSLLKGLIWAIPVLGFIGTVQGLSEAIGGFGSVLSTASDISALRPALQRVTVGLSTGFDTTFIGLTGTLISQLYVAQVRKTEEELLDACKEYCHKHIVGRLRMIT
jgi:hypothetical protein